MADLKGSTAYASKHQHGVQVKETGTTGSPVTEERIAALENQVAVLKANLAILQDTVLRPAQPEASKGDKKKG